MQNEQNKKSKLNKTFKCIILCLAIILAFTGGYFSRYLFGSKISNTTLDVVKIIEKLGYIYDPITGEQRLLTEDEIADAIVDGVLDRYSAYYTAEEYKQITETGKGNLSGMGFTVSSLGYIVRISYNSPAELSGFQVGDKILSVEVDGVSADFAQNQEFSDLMNGAELGKTLTFKIDREGQEKTLALVKSNYVVSYVKYYDDQKTLNFRTNESSKLVPTATDGGMAELDEQTALIELRSFNGKADEQIADALEFMKEQGKTKLILDLRDNGGGTTTILKEIASYLIYNNGAKKSLISYASGKGKSQSLYTTGNKFNRNITSIAVLANENSASASESLIGAMLHYKDGFDESKLVIEKNSDGVAKTYGKGIMQTTYKLVGGGALKLTTHKIYLPDKTTSIHGKGFIATEDNAVEPGTAIKRAIELV